MGWKRKLKKNECFKQELFEVMAKCDMWKRRGKCISDREMPCMLLSKCKIVQEYDKKVVVYMKKGVRTPYLPGVVPGQNVRLF
jgi:hypothetical protein